MPAIGLVLLLMAGAVILELWDHPPQWLGGTRSVVAFECRQYLMKF